MSEALVNELAPTDPATPLPAREAVAILSRILAIDPPSVAQLGASHVAGFAALAKRLRSVFGDLQRRNVDGAAATLNELLAAHPAHPHLAKERGAWRLHHHPHDAPLVPMWTAICAAGLAEMLGDGAAQRLGTCERDGCGRVYVDVSKNASRRFCSLACQNRVKVATFRERAGKRRAGRSNRR
ncbi:MAG TPA: CGNR zinc finger domain-containing protein [Steroidobacteraceae bacterium]|nr:CGNR zinc finger domain-containing protein [Steroidobacteraceae bacterium]